MNEKENKPQETAADILEAIKNEGVLHASYTYQINKNLEAVLEMFCQGLRGKRALDDFYKYEIAYINKLKPSDFPLIFSYNEYGCGFYSPAGCGKELFLYEHVRYRVARHGIAGFINCYKEAERISGCSSKLLCISFDKDTDKFMIKPVTTEQADNICKDVYMPWYEKCKQLIGLPTDLKIRVEFKNITLGRLKELLSDPTPLNLPEAWYEQPKTSGESLLWRLRRIHSNTKCSSDHRYVLRYCESDKAFYFQEYYDNDKKGLNGAIQYHGSPAEGYQQNGSCQIDPSYGWSMHT